MSGQVLQGAFGDSGSGLKYLRKHSLLTEQTLWLTSRLAQAFGQQPGRKGGSADDGWRHSQREFREEQEGKELAVLRASALQFLAMQQVSLNKLEGAFNSREQAMESRLEADLNWSILAGV